MKKDFLIAGLIGLITLLTGCNESDSEPVVETDKQVFIKSISYTSWKKDCYPVYFEGELMAYNNSKISINSSLLVTASVDIFEKTDTTCSSLNDTTDFTFQFEVTDKIVSEEGYETYGLNVTLESSEVTQASENYTLLYIDAEKLHYGQETGMNLGKTPETRHSSVSLDDYYTKIIN
jgi:hypothetical protein